MTTAGVKKYPYGLRGKAKRILHKIQGKQYVHLLHIGKTGGTAVKHILTEYGADSPYMVCLHGHYFQLRQVPEGDSVIFFLRDPISRFISGYHSRQRQGQPRYFSPWSPEEEAAFSSFQTPNQLAEALSSANEQEKAAAQKAMKNIQHVRDSFWYWFESEEYLKRREADILFIGFQESLNEDFEILKSKLKLPNEAKLPDNDIQAHRNPKNLNKKLSDKALQNLKTWYEADYQFLDACKNIIQDRKLNEWPSTPRTLPI